MISRSKSGYQLAYPDHVAVFNAVLADAEGGELWRGDLDLTVDEPKLIALAADLKTTIHVIFESDARYVRTVKPDRLDIAPAVVRLTPDAVTHLGEMPWGAHLTRNAARGVTDQADEGQARNLPELTAYADAHGWTLVDDPPVLPPSEWRGGPSGRPGWHLMFVKGEQAVGYEWFGATSRYEAGRRVLRAAKVRCP
jgi:hypothetical protein